jgi:DNA invertase Pin-like site-specific DNA recombinase
MADKRVRCAIYTRKSSEEGLEQSFNSLDAQREACRAYILSQKHEGWTALISPYDDGGFSGGTMERPALTRLLDDITAAKIDTVVVYKVDRLTRSLGDFSKIIEVFDSHGVSFVSVTQHFNTTTSMGRLTLNVLLSFAQFEREVTGERIRDKFAASKKKGMWMGGMVPLGYDCVDRKLVVNRVEAKMVQDIFRKYLRLGCVRKLKDLLHSRQIRSKVRTSTAGRTAGGRPFSRGALYHLLNNRIYLGEVVHKKACYPGQHDAIVARGLWDKVAARLNENNQAHRTAKSLSTPSVLTGKLFDTNGARFTPTHAVKNGRRYRYYTSQAAVQHAGVKPSITRFPAHQLEHFVLAQIHQLLQEPGKWKIGIKDSPTALAATERAKELGRVWPNLSMQVQSDFVRNIIDRVIVGQGMAWVVVERSKLIGSLAQNQQHSANSKGRQAVIRLAAKFRALHCSNQLRVTLPDSNSFASTPTSTLVTAVARARHWYDEIVAGRVQSIRQLAAQAGLRPRYTRRILQCAILSPEILEAFLTGRHRPDLTLNQVFKGVPLDWQEQKRQILHVG